MSDEWEQRDSVSGMLASDLTTRPAVCESASPVRSVSCQSPCVKRRAAADRITSSHQREHKYSASPGVPPPPFMFTAPGLPMLG